MLLLLLPLSALAETLDGARLVVVNAPIARARLGVAGTNETVSAPTNTAPFAITTNDFVLNQYYTNANQRAWAAVVIGMTNVLGTDKAQVNLYLDQDADGAWERTGLHCRLQGVALLAGAEELSAYLQPNARFLFTNLSTGSGAVSVEANSSQWVRQ